jgi:CHAT domain-containing protein
LYNNGTTEIVSDYAISSYTPTISALLSATPPPTEAFKVMVVIQSKTSHYQPLLCTVDELQKIEDHVPAECLVKLGIPGAPASVENVISHLPTVSAVHFACHGKQNARSPLDSALILEDGDLKVSQIMQCPNPNASLAFLSACQTAMGDENLPDEAIHLAAALLFAGFRGVVATMWYVSSVSFARIVLITCRSIRDVDGPKIADTFYEYLFPATDSTTDDAPRTYPDTSQAAKALHAAVAKLRAENVPFAQWVPFIHLGK